jgi:DNA-binding NarL/FixJ family response regulator
VGVAATALVVDRWALVRLGIAAVLRGVGLPVVAEAEHGRDGLQEARRTDASLLIVGLVDDLSLPDFVRQAKALERGPAVICLVTQLDRDELSALLASGADGVLVRSAAGDELATAVGSVVAGERSLSPAVLALAAQGPDRTGLSADGDDDSVLTAKEREVLAMLASGSANKDIAEALYVTPATVKTHLSHIYAKLGVGDRHEAVARAVALGLLG